MAKVAVYRFEIYDAAAGHWRKQPHCATRAYIDSVNGAIQFHTKFTVDDSELTPEGVYVPVKRE